MPSGTSRSTQLLLALISPSRCPHSGTQGPNILTLGSFLFQWDTTCSSIPDSPCSCPSASSHRRLGGGGHGKRRPCARPAPCCAGHLLAGSQRRHEALWQLGPLRCPHPRTPLPSAAQPAPAPCGLVTRRTGCPWTQSRQMPWSGWGQREPDTDPPATPQPLPRDAPSLRMLSGSPSGILPRMLSSSGEAGAGGVVPPPREEEVGL